MDIHSHLLPCVDPDGPQSLDESLSMARQAWEDGIKVVFATPHVMSDRNHEAGKKAEEAKRRLDEALSAENVLLEIRLGSEIYFTEKLESFLQENNVFLDGGHKFFLVEFPLLSFPVFAEQTLSRIISYGKVPILAHIERNLALSKNLLPVEDLVEMGCLLQINGGSLLGAFGQEPRDKAREILKNGWVHFIASDAHDPLERPPVLGAALREASKLIGEKRAERLVRDNPLSIIESPLLKGGG